LNTLKCLWYSYSFMLTFEAVCIPFYTLWNFHCNF